MYATLPRDLLAGQINTEEIGQILPLASFQIITIPINMIYEIGRLYTLKQDDPFTSSCKH